MLHKIKKTIYCEDLSVRFPLAKPENRWKMLFGKKGWGEWYEALKNISIDVSQDTIVGVIGRNGAGKSTLLRCIAGVYSPNKGKVIKVGQISTLFELGGSSGTLFTGKQYVVRWLRLNGVNSKNWLKIIEEIREFSELGNRLEDPINTYSMGMAARLYFSTATSINHNIYLIDEILAVGDEHFQSKCWGRIRRRLSEGASGIVVTHDCQAILRLSSKAYELKKGKVVANGEPEKVISDYLKISDQLEKKKLVYFSPNCPKKINARSEKDLNFKIPIKSLVNEEVFFNYTIEKLILAKDWQLLFFGANEKKLITEIQGDFEINISISKLPLPEGEYRLNLFLSSSSGKGFDIKSWTTGDSIRINVKGKKSAGLILLPQVSKSL